MTDFEKQVPYVGNPGSACALACYTMVAQYLLPDSHITFNQLAKIANWKEDYVVWGFQIWRWLMDRGVYTIDYDTIDYEAWAKDGLKGLKRSTSETLFRFYEEHTYNLELESKHIELVFSHPHFTYIHRKPEWSDVVSEFNKPGICDLTLNSEALNRRDGFTLHRVVLIDITDDEVVFHDPNKAADGAYRRESLAHFRKVFEGIDGPELARYSLSPCYNSNHGREPS